MSNINFSVTIASLCGCQLKWFVRAFFVLFIWGLFSVADNNYDWSWCQFLVSAQLSHYLLLLTLAAVNILLNCKNRDEWVVWFMSGLLRRIARHNSRCENVISFLSWHRGLLRLGAHTGYWQWPASARRHGAHLSADPAQLPGPKRHGQQRRAGCTGVLYRAQPGSLTRPGPAHPPHSAACLADWSRGRATLIGLSLAKLPPSAQARLSITSPQPRPDQLQSLRISAANTASVPPPGRAAQPFTHQ